jgi:5-methylcytosine-specific restriction endonuclease McrA
MIPFRQRRPRSRLDPKPYRRLCQQVLRRDGWRCQRCGSPADLQVHHRNPRSLLGDDSECNLITLCAKCHGEIHRRPVAHCSGISDEASEEADDCGCRGA